MKTNNLISATIRILILFPLPAQRTGYLESDYPASQQPEFPHTDDCPFCTSYCWPSHFWHGLTICNISSQRPAVFFWFAFLTIHSFAHRARTGTYWVPWFLLPWFVCVFSWLFQMIYAHVHQLHPPSDLCRGICCCPVRWNFSDKWGCPSCPPGCYLPV